MDPALLKHLLFQSLFYLHSQPPLFNLYLGIILKLFPHGCTVGFYLAFLLTGLLFSFTLFFLMTELGVLPWLRTFLTCLFIASPLVIQYENWLFYEYPSALILSLSVLFLCRFAIRNLSRDCFMFFLMMALVIAFRGMFSIYWFLLVMIFLAVAFKGQLKRVLIISLVPFMLVLSLYVKNLVVFNSFSVNDAVLGQTISIILDYSLPKKLFESLVNNNKISDIYRIAPYAEDFSLYEKYGIRVHKTGIPVLDLKLKSTGEINSQNLIYLDVGKKDIIAESYVLKHYPLVVLNWCGMNFIKHYFYPSDRARPFYAYSYKEPLRTISSYYKRFFLWGFDNKNYWALILGLPILHIYGIFIIIRFMMGKEKFSTGVVMSYFTLTSIYLMFLISFNYGDHSRYRFLLDPFYLIVSGLLLTDVIKNIWILILRQWQNNKPDKRRTYIL